MINFGLHSEKPLNNIRKNVLNKIPVRLDLLSEKKIKKKKKKKKHKKKKKKKNGILMPCSSFQNS